LAEFATAWTGGGWSCCHANDCRRYGAADKMAAERLHGGGAGRRCPPGPDSSQRAEGVEEFLPGAVPIPPAEGVIDSLPRGEVVGQCPPGTPFAGMVEQSVDDLAQIGLAGPPRPAASAGPGQQRLDKSPLPVRQIAGIGFAFHTSFYANPQLWNRLLVFRMESGNSLSYQLKAVAPPQALGVVAGRWPCPRKNCRHMRSPLTSHTNGSDRKVRVNCRSSKMIIRFGSRHARRNSCRRVLPVLFSFFCRPRHGCARGHRRWPSPPACHAASCHAAAAQRDSVRDHACVCWAMRRTPLMFKHTRSRASSSSAVWNDGNAPWGKFGGKVGRVALMRLQCDSDVFVT